MLMSEQRTYIKPFETTSYLTPQGNLSKLTKCPICDKECSPHDPQSYVVHLQSKHPLYWAQARKLRQLATLTLVISMILTLLLVSVFYYADQLGFSVMGLATLFLAFSSAFSLRERGLYKRFKNRTMNRKKRGKQATL